MSTLLILFVMLAALAAMIVLGKSRSAAALRISGQVVLLAVIIAGAGYFLYRSDFFGTRDALGEGESRFFAAQGAVAGKYLHEHLPGRKLLLILPEEFGNPLCLERLSGELERNYGGTITIVRAPGGGRALSAAGLKDFYAEHLPGIIVSTVSLPPDIAGMSWLRSSAKERPCLFLIGLPSGPGPDYRAALRNGMISGIIVSRRDYRPGAEVPRDAEKAFAMRYLLLTGENFDRHRQLLED